MAYPADHNFPVLRVAEFIEHWCPYVRNTRAGPWLLVRANVWNPSKAGFPPSPQTTRNAIAHMRAPMLKKLRDTQHREVVIGMVGHLARWIRASLCFALPNPGKSLAKRPPSPILAPAHIWNNYPIFPPIFAWQGAVAHVRHSGGPRWSHSRRTMPLPGCIWQAIWLCLW